MHLLLAEQDPLAHIKDKVLLGTPEMPIVTLHMVTMIVAAALLLWVMWRVGNAIATGPEAEGHRRYVPRGRLAQLVEFIIVALRDQMIEPLLGKEQTRRYLPYLLSLFFFILMINLLGLIPLLDLQGLFWGLTQGDYHGGVVGGTATANLSVNVGLAIIAFFVIQAHGIRELGLGHWLKHFLGGAPVWLAPIMVPVEILGLLIKPAALAVRLFANMVAGHTLMAVLFSFGLMAAAGTQSLLAGAAVTIASGTFAIAIYFLEIFVAFLQAFIFMFLVAVFISQLSHHEHDDVHAEVA